MDMMHQHHGDYHFDGHNHRHVDAEVMDYHQVAPMMDIHHSYDGDEHPIYVTDTDPHGSYVAHEGDEFIVADSHGYGGVAD